MNSAIQDVSDFCAKCNVMKDLKEDESRIELARDSCMHCRSAGGSGIYKADAIYSALKYKERADAFTSKGKSTVVVKRYGKAVHELLEKGESLRGISKILGISVNSVRKCKAEWKDV